MMTDNQEDSHSPKKIKLVIAALRGACAGGSAFGFYKLCHYWITKRTATFQNYRNARIAPGEVILPGCQELLSVSCSPCSFMRFTNS